MATMPVEPARAIGAFASGAAAAAAMPMDLAHPVPDVARLDNKLRGHALMMLSQVYVLCPMCAPC